MKKESCWRVYEKVVTGNDETKNASKIRGREASDYVERVDNKTTIPECFEKYMVVAKPLWFPDCGFGVLSSHFQNSVEIYSNLCSCIIEGNDPIDNNRSVSSPMTPHEAPS